MTTWIQYLFDKLEFLLKWWVIIQPWEQGLRVWMGKKEKFLTQGIYWRVPFFHSVYIQQIRTHYVNLALQSLTTKCGKQFTIGVIVGYSVVDMQKMYNSIGEVEGFITSIVSGRLSDYIETNYIENCTNEEIIEYIMDNDAISVGIDIQSISVFAKVVVKTYRLIQDGSWMGERHSLQNKN